MREDNVELRIEKIRIANNRSSESEIRIKNGDEVTSLFDIDFEYLFGFLCDQQEGEPDARGRQKRYSVVCRYVGL